MSLLLPLPDVVISIVVDFRVCVTLVNITVVVCVIVASCAPAILLCSPEIFENLNIRADDTEDISSGWLSAAE